MYRTGFTGNIVGSMVESFECCFGFGSGCSVQNYLLIIYMVFQELSRMGLGWVWGWEIGGQCTLYAAGQTMLQCVLWCWCCPPGQKLIPVPKGCVGSMSCGCKSDLWQQSWKPALLHLKIPVAANTGGSQWKIVYFIHAKWHLYTAELRKDTFFVPSNL